MGIVREKLGKMAIETTDRGIIVAKPLAWAIFVAVVTGGVWFGTELGSLKTTLEVLSDNVIDSDLEQKELESRVRTVELKIVNSDAIVSRMSSDITKILTTQAVILERLADIRNGRNDSP